LSICLNAGDISNKQPEMKEVALKPIKSGDKKSHSSIVNGHHRNLSIVVSETLLLNMLWFGGGYLNPLSRISFKFTSHFYTLGTAHFRHTRSGSFQEQTMKF
jgi:hypothetical protein